MSASGSYSVNDLINESFKAEEADESSSSSSSSKVKKTKDFTAEEHLKIQNDLIPKLQKEALENTFIGPSTNSKRSVGRPKKSGTSSNPSNTAPTPTPSLRSSFEKTPPTSPKRSSNEQKTNTWGKKAILIKKLIAFMKLYPHLQHSLPHGGELSNFKDEDLESMILYCKENGSNSIQGVEFETVKNIFFMILSQFENICRILCDFGDAPSFLKIFANLPTGSFSEFVKLVHESSEEESESFYSDLKEISIDFIGYFPNNAYSRLAMKTFYKLWDFHVFSKNQHLSSANTNLSNRKLETSKLPQSIRQKLSNNEQQIKKKQRFI
jgi:hypothetical protein